MSGLPPPKTLSMRSDPASTRRWLNDIRSQIELLQRFLGDLDYEAFKDDQLRFYAVTRCLEIISEASRRLPEDLKTRHPSILWKEMAGAGNVYRHGYESVEAYDVWITIQDHLPALRAVVDAELAALRS
jgi:uncharacterized protein with HEPN domain